MTDTRELVFGSDRMAASRLKGYAVGPNRTRMEVYLHSPEETYKIQGAENVVAAHQEIDHVMSPDEAGWVDLE